MKKIFALFAIVGFSFATLPLAFAQQNAEQVTSESNIIANVNLVNQVIVKQEGRLFTLGVNIQNKIGTQDGVMYGVQTYQTMEGKRVLVDEFAILDPLSVKQNEYIYKEFTYPLPTSIGGSVELFAFLKTDRGILLSAAPFGTAQVEPVSVVVDLKECALDVAAKTFSCTLVNKTTKDQNVVLVTQVKQGDSVFAPVAQALTPQVVILKTKEEKVITQSIDAAVLSKNAFFETIIIDQADSSLVERTTVSYVSPEQLRSIDNVLIEQTSAKDYVVKIISLAGRSETNARVSISDASGICATQDVLVKSSVTPVAFTLEKKCNTTLVSVTLLNVQGIATDSKEVTHKTLFPEENKISNLVWVILALLVIVFVWVLFKNRRTPTLKA